MLVEPEKVYVVFSNSDKRSLAYLKDGFQHVSLLYKYKDFYVFIDPLSNGTEVQVYTDVFMHTQHLRVMEVVPKEFKMTPWVLNYWSCVEFVKRAMGIRKPCIITPYQLYKHICKEYNTNLFNQKETT